MSDRINDNLKVLKRCYLDTEAEIIVQLLQDNDIEAFVENNLPHSVWPVTDDSLVVVRETDYERAKLILHDYEQGLEYFDEEGEEPCQK